MDAAMSLLERGVMRINCVHPSDFGASEWAQWQALRAANAAYASPYHSPGFIKAVGAARADTRVAVIEDGGQVQGFLPVHRPSPFAAMALGAPISDYQGLICAPGLDLTPTALCTGLKVGRLDFTAVRGDQPFFASGVRGGCEAFVAKLAPGGATAYLAELKRLRNDTVKKMDRKRRALEREHGSLQFTACDPSSRHFEQLLTWSRARCRRTRQPPVWETQWVVRTLAQIRASTCPDFTPILCTETLGDRLIAAQWLLSSGPVLHTWIIGHDPAFDPYSPGMALTRKVIEWAADQGYSEVDLGLGEYRFKRQLTNMTRTIGYGSVGRLSWSWALRRGAYAARDICETAPLGWVGALPRRAMRRLDAHRALGLRWQRDTSPIAV
jgi:CelD/BcsL family acetyltransferase involved in cellulose biosynthesis